MINRNINSSEISVVVQGPIDKQNTPLCLKSIRKHLPDAEIILSTWVGSCVTKLDYDVLILSKDPGGHTVLDYRNNKIYPSNLARQLYSTQKGIEAANNDYIMKIRSDIVLNSNNFLSYFYLYPEYDECYKIFNNRILISNYFTRHSYNSDWLFHPSDWITFGTKKDIIFYYDVPLPNNETLCQFFKNSNNLIANPGKTKQSRRYYSEQYIFIKCLRKKGYMKFSDCMDITENLRLESEKYLINNFIVLDYGVQLDISYLKYNFKIHFKHLETSQEMAEDIYNFSEWEKLYKKHCIDITSNDLASLEVRSRTSDNISVVVQGPIDANYTHLCLTNIRRHLPGAEIILSTWEGSNINGLDFDIASYSKDPGGNYVQALGLDIQFPDNLLRQLHSTQNGIALATRPYILKIRSDIIINDNQFLTYYEKYLDYNEGFRIFSNRLLIANYYTRHCYRSNWLFHPSDWIVYGSQRDIELLYYVPYPTEEDHNLFYTNSDTSPLGPAGWKQSWRFAPEQYIFINCLRKKSYFKFHDCTDVTDELRYESEKYLINNFVVLDYGNQLNISFVKFQPDTTRHIRYSNIDGKVYKNIYDFNEWYELYKKYCIEGL